MASGILKKFRTRSPAIREFLAEFFGTFILIIYGNAAFASTILEGKGVPDVFGVTWAWGVGVILGITISGGVSGGHINPGVTVGFAAVGKFPWRKVPVYLLAQHLGGFFASAVLYFTYYDSLNVVKSPCVQCNTSTTTCSQMPFTPNHLGIIGRLVPATQKTNTDQQH
ncbi:Aquaporin-10 [Araneus ventricosus]|uniref:Aquaporin-10 n=1 Tax=Araneus ventricosus TaxID=182803 RepID=A0A4Y2EM66_ARAVE|nr:Aquaporin-10 [Araneus ventricosus]